MQYNSNGRKLSKALASIEKIGVGPKKISPALKELEHKRRKLFYDLYSVSKAVKSLNSAGVEHAKGIVEQTAFMLSDREVLILLLWAVISPALALAYIIWIKYPKLRVIAIPLTVLSLVQFASQWGGVYWMLQRLGVI